MSSLFARLQSTWRDPNPILRKELLAVLRTPLYLRAVVVALVSIGLLVVSVALAVSSERDTTEAGRILFQVFFGGTSSVMIVAGAVLGATSVTQEREAHTIDALTLANMSPGRILAGKLSAVFVAMALLPVVAVPTLAMVAVFGGVTFGQIVIATVYVLLWGALSVTFGAAVSSYSPNTRLALLQALPVALIALFTSGGMLSALGVDLARRYALSISGPFFFADAYFAMPLGGAYAHYLVVLPLMTLGVLAWFFLASGYAGLLEPTQDRSRPLKHWMLGGYTITVGAAVLSAKLMAADASTRQGFALGGIVFASLVAVCLSFVWVGDPLVATRRMEQEASSGVLAFVFPPTLRGSWWFLLIVVAMTVLVGPWVLAGASASLLWAGVYALGWMAAHIGIVGLIAARPGSTVASARVWGLVAHFVTMIGVWLLFALIENSHGSVETKVTVVVISPVWAVVAAASALSGSSYAHDAQRALQVGAVVYAVLGGALFGAMQLRASQRHHALTRGDGKP